MELWWKFFCYCSEVVATLSDYETAIGNNGIFCVMLRKATLPSQTLPQTQLPLSSLKAVVADDVSAPPIPPLAFTIPLQKWLSIVCHSLPESFLWLQKCSQPTGAMGRIRWRIWCPQKLPSISESRLEKIPQLLVVTNLYSFPSFCRGIKPQLPPSCSWVHTSLI